MHEQGVITPHYIIGFSGHRHLTAEQETVTAAAIQGIFKELAALASAQRGQCELYSSIAYGADQLAIKSADAMGMPVHLILPKPLVEPGAGSAPEGFAADFFEPGSPPQPAAWDFAQGRIADAEDGRHGGSCRVVPFTDSAPECYYDAGLQILSASDVLVAVWNQQPAAGLGGTSQWVEQAQKLELPLVIINPETGGVLRYRLDQFGTDPGTKIIHDVSETAKADKSPVKPGGTPALQLFHRLDDTATRLGREFRNHLVRSILLHGAATTVAAIAAIITSKESPWKLLLIALAAIESGILLWLMWRNYRIHRTHLHEKWIETRFAAELLRSQLAAGPLLDPLHPLISNHHHPEWKRFALSTGLLVHREQPPRRSLNERREDYLKHRLHHPDEDHGQIRHYARQQQIAETRFHLLMRWGRLFTNVATVFVIGALLFKVYKAAAHGTLSPSFAVFTVICFSLFPIILPLAGGVFLSLRSALDTGRRTYRYRQLVQRLTIAAHSIAELKTEASVRRAVAFTEDMLLDELIEWRLAEQQNGGH